MAIFFITLLQTLFLIAILTISLIAINLLYEFIRTLVKRHDQKKATAQREHEQHLQRMENAAYKKAFFREIA